MSKAIDTVQHLCEVFERILAHPPSKVGRRLCSERELATRLAVERITIQKAFDQLVDKGYIARRHGSGTYVRKVPPASRGKTGSINGQSFTAADFFAEPASTPARKQALQEHRRLKVAFLDKVGLRHNEMRSLLYSGVVNRLKESGHQIKLVQFEKADEELVSREEAMAKIHDNPCDGYILWAPMIPHIDPAFLKDHAPVSYVAGGERISDYEYSPLTRIGTEDAFVRAVLFLKKAGHSKIAYFTNYGLGMTENLQRFYDITLGAFELEYRKTEFLEPDDVQITQRMRKLFNGAERPEAVYIADDILLRRVVPALEKLNVIPGRDIGVITLSNRGVSLPAKYKWSRLEFDPFQLGRLAADNLLLEIQNAGEVICSVENLATWYPGTTHLCQ